MRAADKGHSGAMILKCIPFTKGFHVGSNKLTTRCELFIDCVPLSELPGVIKAISEHSPGDHHRKFVDVRHKV